MRYNYNTTATQKRLPAYSSGKSTYASQAGVAIRGFFAPIAPSQAIEQLQIVGQPYGFNTAGHKDIKVNDVLIINSVEYRVKGVARYTLGAIDELRCILEESVTT